MNLGDQFKGIVDRSEPYYFKSLNGITLADLHRPPMPGGNPLSWLGWHIARVADRGVGHMTGKPQVWIADGWHKKFGKAPDPDDRGAGYTMEQVAALRIPDVKMLVDYYKASRASLDVFLATLQPADLDRQVTDFKGSGTTFLYMRLHALVMEHAQHIGQMAYVRGLLSGPGWMS